MIPRATQSTRTISRRTTLQAALAAVIAGQVMGKPAFAAAQADAPAPWNWGGNAGHTGELSGPGLDLESPIGVLWRLPLQEFVSDSYDLSENFIGNWNGVLYTLNGDSLWARRLQDGAFLWAQSPDNFQETPTSTPSAVASPEADAETVFFSRRISIDNGFLLAPMSNGELWGLDAATGEFRWKMSLGSPDDYSIPTVLGHIAFVDQIGAISAYELTDPPALRWSWNPETEGWSQILGVFNEHVYVDRRTTDERKSIHALSTSDGSELWRLTENDLEVNNFLGFGVSSDGIALNTYSEDKGMFSFMMINHGGEEAWRRSTYGDSGSWWMTRDTIISASTRSDLTIESIHPENGATNWQFETPFYVGGDVSDYAAYYGLLCDGKAYGGVPDNDWTGGPLMVIIDPVTAEVVAARGLALRPVFLADGIMIAYDEDTDEIVAIGSVSGGLQAGGRATVTRDATLRGAPNDAAIERAQVATGALVEITGDGETSNGAEWVPVTIPETGKSGYLPADALSGQDGSIRFEAIDSSQLSQFGQLTVFPKFGPGTRAEITEETELRGAPSETSATKGTLAAGTVVKVTSRPTIGASVDVEWCSVSVDATGETGWVPTSVLKLLPPA